VTEYVLKGLADVESPQGVVAIVRKPATDWKRLLRHAPKPIIILDGIQNAGNAATIVRTAEAAGAAGVITTPKSAHLFTPKALRGAMGSSLRLPILEHQPIAGICEKLAAAHYEILTTASPVKDSVAYTTVDWTKAWAIVVGQEGNGLSPEWEGKTHLAVHIPMDAAVESLNVATAAALLLCEARRKK
jgi:TrmH family RNA methyltransferase